MTTVVDCPPTMKVLLERRTAGFTVEVGVIPTTGEIILEGKSANYKARIPVLPEQAMRAFEHPCAFLPFPDRFFRDLKEGESEDESSIPAQGNVAVMDAADPMDYCSGCNRSLLAHESGPFCDNCSEDGT